MAKLRKVRQTPLFASCGHSGGSVGRGGPVALSTISLSVSFTWMEGNSMQETTKQQTMQMEHKIWVYVLHIYLQFLISKSRTVSDQGGYKAARVDRNINTVQIWYKYSKQSVLSIQLQYNWRKKHNKLTKKNTRYVFYDSNPRTIKSYPCKQFSVSSARMQGTGVEIRGPQSSHSILRACLNPHTQVSLPSVLGLRQFEFLHFYFNMLAL